MSNDANSSAPLADDASEDGNSKSSSAGAQQSTTPENSSTDKAGSNIFRAFVSHPTYKKWGPWLALLRRFGPLVTTISLLISIVSLVVTSINVKHTWDIYLHSLVPTLFISLDMQKQQLVISNPSGADAKTLQIGCARFPSTISQYTPFIVPERNATMDFPRDTLAQEFPIAPNCPMDSAAPDSTQATELLTFFACYYDERDRRHALARLFSYKPSDRNESFQTLSLDSPFGRQLLEDTARACSVPLATVSH